MSFFRKVLGIAFILVLIPSVAFAFVPGYERDNELSNSANRMFRKLHQRTMPFLSNVLSTSKKPTTDELPQGWAAVSHDTSTADTTIYALFFNVNGVVVKTNLTIA